ncbi:hypothetical protein ABDK96_01885 [Citricoccus nitrophenolicus]|uniref:Uncharacterized protein n=1 Tax=Citricoccus nitrophenolicus TaxID=863575 RepID=A0ABV0IE50_9MICC
MSRPAVLTDPAWKANAVDAIERIVRRDGVVTSEDLRKEITAPEHANQIGAAFLAASRRHLIVATGYRASRDRSRRHGVIRTWALHPEAGGAH